VKTCCHKGSHATRSVRNRTGDEEYEDGDEEEAEEVLPPARPPNMTGVHTETNTMYMILCMIFTMKY